jgi:hypothetical protein
MTMCAAASDTGAVAYDEQLADRIRDAVQSEQGLPEKRMFGGLAFFTQRQHGGQRERARWLTAPR